MHRDWTPSIVPAGDGQTVYLVADDLGKLNSVWREADVETTDLETVITDLFSEDFAHELRRRCDLQLRDVPASIQDFVELHEGHRHRQLSLRLV
jgi:hypothetical protein